MYAYKRDFNPYSGGIMQKFYYGDGNSDVLKNILDGTGAVRYMLIHSPSLKYFNLGTYIKSEKRIACSFGDIEPNPDYATVCRATELFNGNECDGIIAIGGGSVIDVAKTVKMFCNMPQGSNNIEEAAMLADIPLLAIPTTAGTGSESTCFAAIYINGVKHSFNHKGIIPTHVYLDGTLLNTLPVYQKKCTMLDALCQGIESIWSVNSTAESVTYARKAVEIILNNMDRYIDGDNAVNREMLLAANYSGRAICISQTTAAHAMSYKITSMFGLPHGHAVAICLPYVWRYIAENCDKCVDSRGETYLKSVLNNISELFGVNDISGAVSSFNRILSKYDIVSPNASEEQIKAMVEAVNAERLKNTPVFMNGSAVYEIYRGVFGFDNY